MSRKDIPIQHMWCLKRLHHESYGVYTATFDSNLVPGVKFDIFCGLLNQEEIIMVLSKTPCTPVANATIEIKLDGCVIEKTHLDLWTSTCALTCSFSTMRDIYRRDIDYWAAIRYECFITLHDFEPQPQAHGNLYGNLKHFITTPDLSDMVIVIDEEEIPVHKIILAACSPVFLAMFKADMTECVNKQIVVRDIEIDVMKTVIKFMYTGIIEPVPDCNGLLLILEVSDKYQIMDLKEFCEKELSKKITTNNVLEILERAWLFGVPQLVETLISFMTNNKSTIIGLEDFADLYRRKPELLFEFVIRSISLS